MLLTETGGRARGSLCWGIFAEGCCTVTATKQRCAPQITGAESKKPKIPQQSCLLLALPWEHVWRPCLGPVCLCPLALRALPPHSRECGHALRPPGLSFASGERHPARPGLVRHPECDAFAEMAHVEMAKIIIVSHTTHLKCALLRCLCSLSQG